MNNHTVTLKTAKRMEELGYAQDTWYVYGLMECEADLYHNFDRDVRQGIVDGTYPAPIATEILECLPSGNTQTTEMRIQIKECGYYVGYIGGETSHHENLAEALGQLWIQLVEEGIIITTKE